MTKKGPLGKAEKFYIKEHCQEQDSKKIAKDLDRAISLVESYAKRFKRKAASSPKEEAMKKVKVSSRAEGCITTAQTGKESEISSQLARKTGVTIMTENASTLSDELK